MRSAATIEHAISQMLRESLPAHLQNKIGIKDAKEWVREHLEFYTEEKTRFPDQTLLPWTNMIAYDDWELDTFFVILILREDAIELFCGTGRWPEVREFAEGDTEDIPTSRLPHAWASRFHVPCRPIIIKRAEVKKWIGCDW